MGFTGLERPAWLNITQAFCTVCLIFCLRFVFLYSAGWPHSLFSLFFLSFCFLSFVLICLQTLYLFPLYLFYSLFLLTNPLLSLFAQGLF